MLTQREKERRCRLGPRCGRATAATASSVTRLQLVRPTMAGNPTRWRWAARPSPIKTRCVPVQSVAHNAHNRVQ